MTKFKALRLVFVANFANHKSSYKRATKFMKRQALQSNDKLSIKVVVEFVKHSPTRQVAKFISHKPRKAFQANFKQIQALKFLFLRVF